MKKTILTLFSILMLSSFVMACSTPSEEKVDTRKPDYSNVEKPKQDASHLN